jgi:hypothetical protein
MSETVYALWAKAAINVALRAWDKDKADYELRRAAEIHPPAIADKITALEKQIELLRSYLPKEKSNG